MTTGDYQNPYYISPFPCLVPCAIVLLICAALGGCSVKFGSQSSGSSQDTTVFDQPNIGILFNYPVWLGSPTAFKPSSPVGGPPTAGFALPLGDHDGIEITRYDDTLTKPIKEPGMEDAIKPSLDALVAKTVGISEATSKKVHPGGLVGFSYDLPMSGVPDGQIKKTLIFDGTTEYVFDCLSTQAHRTEIAQSCQIALNTVHLR